MHTREAIENYIAFDKSDPFTAARIAAHRRLGLDRPNKGEDCSYSAETIKDKTLGFERTLYINIQRP